MFGGKIPEMTISKKFIRILGNSIVKSTRLPGTIYLSNATIFENSLNNSVIGHLSITGGQANYIFTKIDDPDNKFSLVNKTLRLSGSLDFETNSSHTVTIQADNGIDFPVIRTFTINVVNTIEGVLGPTTGTLTIDDLEGTTIATLTGLDIGADEKIFSISPDDGRFTFSDTTNRILKGESPVTVGSTELLVTTTAGRTLTILITATEVEGLYLSTIDGVPISSGNITTNTKPTLTGYVRSNTGVSGLTIHFLMPNGTENGTAVTDSEGDWTYTYTQDLPAGSYNLADLMVTDFPVGEEALDSITIDDAITFIASTMGVSTVAMPTHQAGDLLVACVFRDGGTFTLPSGWTATSAFLSAGGYLGRVFWKVAATSSEPSIVSTNATDTVVMVYRGANNAAPIGAINTVFAASGTTRKNADVMALQNTDSTSWLICMAAIRSTTLGSIGASWTVRQDHTNSSSTSRLAVYDTNGPVNTDPQSAFTNSGTDSMLITVELKSHG
ncbi:hypothetical protein EVB97_335 [Rhizobium phage RHph_Y65]|uniref:Bacterial Ig-like domain-containing protein n=1 Tax=Rhizobium phage RHph_Y65 TaxID=2509785 RepID=A0A7S5UWZ6_9CAUD|nr:hypothetical protein PQC17_gp326 [Rhizobium phage RHph_Y65]QIG72873.1 hypothetical protein EVB97_335 [Rhizobium phage RHph_Y65]